MLIGPNGGKNRGNAGNTSKMAAFTFPGYGIGMKTTGKCGDGRRGTEIGNVRTTIPCLSPSPSPDSDLY
jgi:hypothetical protein